MMMSIFSIFDPSLSLLKFSLFIGLFFLLFFPSFYWLNGAWCILSSIFFKFFSLEVKLNFKGIFLFYLSLFFMVFYFNFVSLFSYIYCLTSQLYFTMVFSFVFWLFVVVFGIFKNFSAFFSHLVPMGTPYFLISFMIVVELISNLVRPLALAFRLVANMVAGHLILSLMVNFVLFLSFFDFGLGVFGFFFQLILLVMEMGVSFIQAYVFCMLLFLYLEETY